MPFSTPDMPTTQGLDVPQSFDQSKYNLIPRSQNATDLDYTHRVSISIPNAVHIALINYAKQHHLINSQGQPNVSQSVSLMATQLQLLDIPTTPTTPTTPIDINQIIDNIKNHRISYIPQPAPQPTVQADGKKVYSTYYLPNLAIQTLKALARARRQSISSTLTHIILEYANAINTKLTTLP